MKSIFILLVVVSFLVACKKHPCYSSELEASMQHSFCTQDCPGICGCDGKFYCNSCMAALEGIAEDPLNTTCY